MKEKLNIDSNIEELLMCENPVELFEKLNNYYKSYPFNGFTTAKLVSGCNEMEMAFEQENTLERKKEYIGLLEIYLPKIKTRLNGKVMDKIWGNTNKEVEKKSTDLAETIRLNAKIIEKWIKDKTESFSKDENSIEQNIIQNSTPEPIPDNIDTQNATQTVFLLIKLGFLEYLTKTKGLNDTQAFKLMGTLTKVHWDLIRRYYNGYNNGKDYPKAMNKNNPDNEITRTWFTNLINEYKIKLTE